MIYKPEFANQARAMCRLGATDEELAEHFGACVRTIYRWRNTHEEFAEAVVVGKDHADARVERALYSRAVGCTVERTKVFKSAGDPDPVYATYKHQLPPDATAALHWLRVRQPEKWRIRDEPEEEDELGDIILQAFARVGKLDRLTEDEGQSDPVPPHRPEQPSPPHPTPPPEAAAPHPDPDTPPVDDKAPQPRLCPQDDTGPAPDADLAPPPVPVPPDPKPRPKPPLATAPEPAPPPFPVLNFSPRGYG